MLKDKVKFKKRNLVEGFDYVIEEEASLHKRDFGATYMTPDELKRAVKRCHRRANRSEGSKKQMYLDQIAAYEERLLKKYDITV